MQLVAFGLKESQLGFMFQDIYPEIVTKELSFG